jgi:hypothetical protein
MVAELAVEDMTEVVVAVERAASVPCFLAAAAWAGASANPRTRGRGDGGARERASTHPDCGRGPCWTTFAGVHRKTTRNGHTRRWTHLQLQRSGRPDLRGQGGQ